MDTNETLKGKRPADYTPDEVRALGWKAEARDEDGKLVTMISHRAGADGISEFVRENRADGLAVTVFP